MMNMKIPTASLLTLIIALLAERSRASSFAGLVPRGSLRLVRQPPKWVPRDNNGSGSISRRQLGIRGGGNGLLEKLGSKLPSKSLTIAFLIQGALFNLAPRLMNKLYGYQESKSELAEFLTENIGAAILSTGFCAYNAIFRRASTNKAIGMCSLVWVINYVQWFLFRTYKAAEMGTAQFLFSGLLSSATAYAGLANKDWATPCFMVAIAFFGSTAIFGIVAPGTALQKWGIKDSTVTNDSTFRFMMRCLSSFVLVLESYNLSLIQGMDPGKAVGLASLLGYVSLLSNLFVSKETRNELGQSKGFLFWLVYFALHISAIFSDFGGRMDPGHLFKIRRRQRP